MDDRSRRALDMGREDGLHRLDGGDGLAVAGNVVVSEFLQVLPTSWSICLWSTPMKVSDLFEESLDDLDAVTPLGSLVPRFEELAIVVVVDGGFELGGSLVFNGQFDAAFARMAVPEAVGESELHLLFDVAGKVVGGDPTGMDVEGGLLAGGIAIFEAELNGVPGRPVDRPDGASLASGADADELAA